jgi:hypothetical protein
MQATWETRAFLAGLGVAIGVVFVLSSATSPSRGALELESQTRRQRDRPQMGLSQQDPHGLPNQGTHTVIFVRSTDGGGAVFKGLGTVSHASIDNNFVQLTGSVGRVRGKPRDAGTGGIPRR